MPSTELVAVVEDWPQPSTGNDGPVLRYGRGPVVLAYDTGEDMIAVVSIPICLQVICGHPNDEVLRGHRLYGKGLTFYSVHRVENSSRLLEMERLNSVHPSHNAVEYLNGKEHWVFTFQNATVEIIALSSRGSAVSFKVFNSWAAANAYIAASEA